MFDFKNANMEQKSAISHVDGPLLITAGPGTGKTFTLVQRIVYLIQECNVLPSEIMVTTFTEKVSKELGTEIKIDSLTPSAFVPIGFTYLLDSEGYHLLDKDGYYLFCTQAAGPNGGECVIIPHDLPFPVPMEQEDRINSLICL